MILTILNEERKTYLSNVLFIGAFLIVMIVVYMFYPQLLIPMIFIILFTIYKLIVPIKRLTYIGVLKNAYADETFLEFIEEEYEKMRTDQGNKHDNKKNPHIHHDYAVGGVHYKMQKDLHPSHKYKYELELLLKLRRAIELQQEELSESDKYVL